MGTNRGQCHPTLSCFAQEILPPIQFEAQWQVRARFLYGTEIDLSRGRTLLIEALLALSHHRFIFIP